MTETPDRFLRQQDLVPRGRLSAMTATVIGVGAIGRQVAIQLAALGCPRLQLIDFDTVEPTNITTQGYFHADRGCPKIDATAGLLWQIEPQLDIETINDRFRPPARRRRRRLLLRRQDQHPRGDLALPRTPLRVLVRRPPAGRSPSHPYRD